MRFIHNRNRTLPPAATITCCISAFADGLYTSSLLINIYQLKMMILILPTHDIRTFYMYAVNCSERFSKF